ncbi:MAG: hypothetical protein A2725_03310 [Candidatus Magasanikbacteria bacterium RIFCSPHIGHO2_01_FULL_33_34]|uniref:Uncharacterized protein n=1 Tax=Candidatus Magasanikbacteria bacterium RIFCSPHIGHO2_01_FULL_33_34 TaxID=1798671 RepID=A0A1F6LGX0_9BACT|nr:MAG: hypothetical protein A2725_03310 [Candidatus Magasanikbacteria bacterium RIFCSPHIGHO2_01_FULL_33_34]OGH66157.1 MAG: hypothetical protein A3B83_00800 [Candidatus Magasanikbacteria bacterium RIFCSPHIGHO2_02_FULL_33_17]OGH76003.1 MAG: hypothetical protein A3A89_00710 [Candidatus Magasanikbacteria bacterium RIFCSPLOWO2_01_FULL_33_34]
MFSIKKIIIIIVLLSSVVLPQIVSAQGLKNAFGGTNSPLETVRGQAGFEASDSLGTISGRVINVALSMVGLMFLLLMVYAGFLWMTARGEEDQVNKAKSIIKGTVIGLVLVLSAYAITFLVAGALNK